jgi:predicted acylesterase/phospholipase RssA
MRSAPACRRKGACNSIDGANHRAQAATAELSDVCRAVNRGLCRARTPRKASGGGTVNVLALSGGGAGAAFGAGALTGLSRAGIRPEFHVVTGVSAGALTAPFAFLGPAWDDELTESFSGQRSANLVQLSLTGLLFGSSVFKGRPLADLVNHYATEEMLQAVAAEAAFRGSFRRS